MESWGTSNNQRIYYTYDVDGSLISFRYNNNEYFYIRNLQGDIIKIIDISGNVLVTYSYDAFGNTLNTTDTSGISLSTINPYRYRGYRYDLETGFYYLQSRYYNPQIGRFISPDSINYLNPMSNSGENLYTYTANNPVMYTDSTGYAPEWWNNFWNSTAGKITGTILVVAVVVGLSILTAGWGGALTIYLGGSFWAAVAGGALGGAISGAIYGAGISMISQGFSDGYTNISYTKVVKDTLIGMVSGAIIGAAFAAAGRGLGLLGKTKLAQRQITNWGDTNISCLFGSKSGNFTFIRYGRFMRFEASIQHGLHYHMITSKVLWEGIFIAQNQIAGFLGGSFANHLN
ncbi:RHS repeat-associated core domain-containing protein [Acholeplasma manati]|uniref:RHS repeat-associated core domain-containing protein n=1 Tax=Paracholeplasma manati TaxID=591373 RepID=A0ABT2Y4V6_9MOLU|nr:RHS repeat-associated core domain-containing protein [Paracholeplasma manati]MCV2231764.1 RHS repeat-associated core domain-containing protein [Paracholeplasma manati]